MVVSKLAKFCTHHWKSHSCLNEAFLGSCQTMSRAGAPARASAKSNLNLNTCNFQQLSEIVTPAKADSILADRALLGGYTSWDQLETVDGIGPKTVEKLQSAGVTLHGGPHTKASPSKVAQSSQHAPQHHLPGAHQVYDSMTHLFGHLSCHQHQSGSSSSSGQPSKHSTNVQGQASQASAPGISPASSHHSNRPPHHHSSSSTQGQAAHSPLPAKHKPSAAAAASGKSATRWWKAAGNSSAPFPAEFAYSAKRPKDYDYIRMAPANRPGMMVYKGSLISAAEANIMQAAWKQRSVSPALL